MIVRVQPVVDHSVRGLCTRPYPGHKKGCPNFGKRRTCPPHAPLIEDVLDLQKSVYAIFNIFPFGEHVEKMRLKHPDWSERQLACCLYWQGTARMQLRLAIGKFERKYLDLFVVHVPEAMGVNVTATMESLGHILEWPPRRVAYQVALGGYRRIKA